MSDKNVTVSGIDLSKFCGDDDSRLTLKEPRNNEEFIYATNGCILIRLSKSLAPDFNNIITNECPDYEKVITNEAEFNPVSLSDIQGALDSFIPEYINEYEKVECPECNGEGYIECTECGNEKECEECLGDGEINTDKIIGKIMTKKSVPFFSVHIDFKYLSLIKEAMEAYPSSWSVSIKGKLEPVQFDADNIVIVVQPMNVW